MPYFTASNILLTIFLALFAAEDKTDASTGLQETRSEAVVIVESMSVDDYSVAHVPLRQRSDNVNSIASLSLTNNASCIPNAIAYYPLNGMPDDASGNNHDGVIVGNPSPTTDRFGSNNGAYSFDGNSYISIPDDSSLNLSEYTISAWVNSTNLSGYRAILAKGESFDTDKLQFSLFVHDNKVEAWYENPNDDDHILVSSTGLSTNTWYHVAATRKSSGLFSLYLNGMLEDTLTDVTGPAFPINANVIIGARTNSPDRYQDHFNGKIDEVSLVNRCLSPAEITQLYEGNLSTYSYNYLQTCDLSTIGLDTTILTGQSGCDSSAITVTSLQNPIISEALVGYYPLDGNANDKSGWGHDGSIQGSQLAPDRFDFNNQAFEFDGADDYIELPDFELDSSFSVSIWINSNIAYGTMPSFIDQWEDWRIVGEDGSQDEPWLGGQPGLEFSFYDGSTRHGIGFPNAMPNEWYHVVGVYDAVLDSAFLYVDGSFIGRTFIPNRNPNDNPTLLGVKNGLTADHLPGKIDEVSLYKRVLSPAEISTLYTTTPGPGSTLYAQSCDLSKIGLDTISNFCGTDLIVTSAQSAISSDLLFLYYPFTENGEDKSGWEKDPTVNGAILVGDRFGNSNAAYNFDGIDDVILTSAWDSLNPRTSDFSIALWAKTSAVGQMQTLAMKTSCCGAQNFYAFSLDAGGAPTFEIGLLGLNENCNSLTPVNDGLWHHLVMTRTTGVATDTLRIYIDGELDAISITNDLLDATPDGDFQIGLGKDGSTGAAQFPFGGSLDDLSFFKRSLSKSEIQQQYLENHLSSSVVALPDSLLDFGSILVLQDSSQSIFLSNTTCDVLLLDSIITNSNQFSVTQTASSIAPFGSIPIGITYTPSIIGPFVDTLSIYADSLVALAVIRGIGIGTSDIALSTTVLMGGTLLECAALDTLSFAIFSNGIDTVSWSANEAAAWMSLSVFNGNIAPGDSTIVDVYLDVSSLGNGTYLEDISIISNDPLQPNIALSVGLNLNGLAIKQVVPDSLLFGIIGPGNTASLTVTISNGGCDTIHVSMVSTSDPVFIPSATAIDVLPYSSSDIMVDFSPTNTQVYNATLVLESDYDNDTILLEGIACMDSPTILNYEMTCIADSIGIDSLLLTNESGCDSLLINLTSLQLPISTEGLVAAYTFTGNAKDESGRGYNGLVNGATQEMDRFGNSDGAYLFDGSNDWIAANGVAENMQSQASFSVSTWFKTTDVPSGDQRNIMASASYFQNTPENIFRIGTGSDGDIYISPSSGSNNVRGGTYNDGQYHHLVIRLSSADNILDVFVDNQLVGTVNSFLVNWQLADRFSFGQEFDGPSPTDFFNGSLDEFLIFNRKISDQEILQLFLENKSSAQLLLPQDSLIDFGIVTQGDSASFTTYLTNTTCDTITIDDIYTTQSTFELSSPAGDILPYQSLPVVINFHPDTTTLFIGQLKLESPSDTVSIALRGLGCISQPLLVYNPDTALCTGEEFSITTDIGVPISWSNGYHGDTLTVSQAGVYYAIYSNGNGCILYTDSVEVTMVPDAFIAINGASTLCLGDNTILEAQQASSYNWSTGASTPSITVQPTADTYYSLTATNSQGCTYVDSVLIQVIDPMPPGQVSNMIPGDNATGLASTVTFSWLPGDFSSTYDLYIWKTTDAKPAAPTYQNLQQIILNHSGLLLQENYHWQVHSKNSCQETVGPLQTFSTRLLPDLVIQNVQVPASAFSGQSITVSWEVHNLGAGTVGNSIWTDIIQLSEDNIRHGNIDPIVASDFNVTALNAGESYANTATFVIPQGISGSYFIFISTDGGYQVVETDNDNNFNTFGAFIPITLTPPPDLHIASVLSPANSFSGQRISIQFEVENLGTGVVPVGEWVDHIYLSTEPLWTGNTQLLKTISRSIFLGPGESYTVIDSVDVPTSIQGDYYFHIQTDAENNVYEFIAEDNNLRTTPIHIFLTPPSDLQITSFSAPSLIDNHELVDLSWTIANNGANHTLSDLWEDRIYLSSLDTFNLDSCLLISKRFRNGILEIGNSYNTIVQARVPVGLNGTFHWYLQTDVMDQELEFIETNNTSSSIEMTIHSPDLSVEALQHSNIAFSGQSLIIQWQNRNLGPAALIDRTFQDSIGIASYAVFDPDSVNWLANSSFTGSILVDSVVQREAIVKVPQGMGGDYYFYLKSDATEHIFENGNEGNNIIRSDSLLTVNLNSYPDLRPDSLLWPDTIQAGEIFSFEYVAVNEGAESTLGQTWSDRVYLSKVDTFGPTASVVKTRLANVELDAGDSYILNGEYTLPRSLAEGYYHPYVRVDYLDEVYEFQLEGNNLLQADSFFVQAHPPADLVLDSAYISSGDLNTGNTITLKWKVVNLGDGTTTAQTWMDRVFLSTDTQWDEGDLFLGEKIKETELHPNSSYFQTLDVLIPNDSIGEYYLLFICDYKQANEDSNYSNNIYSLGGTNPGMPLDVALTPSVDLQVSFLEAPTTAVAGQPITVSWSGTNSGTGTIAESQWQDYLYLAPGPSLSNSTRLGGRLRSDSLVNGVFYNDSITLDLPLNISGNVYLVLRTDRNNQIYEHNAETNNLAFRVITIQDPPPVDLLVGDISIGLDTVLAGDSLTVDWQILNNGNNSAFGTLTEAIYFSRDSIWDVADQLLLKQAQSIQIPPLGSQLHSGRFRVDMVDLGFHYLIIRTDINNNFLEGTEDNNSTVGPPVFIKIKQLPINVLTQDTLFNGSERYYQTYAPDSLRGASLLIQLTSNEEEAVNKVFTSFDEVPSQTEYNVASLDPYQASQDVTISDLQEGDYFTAIYGLATSKQFQYISLLATIQPFAILRVVANRGGNTGSATVKITGAQFEENMTAALRNTALNTELHAYEVRYINPTTAYATFSLDAGSYIGHNEQHGLDTGFYDIKLIKSNGDTTVLINAYEIYEGSSPEVKVNVVYPDRVRTFRIAPINIEYENTSGIDVPIPRFLLASLDGTPLGETEADLRNFIGNGTASEIIDQAFQEVLVELVDQEQPMSGVLRAGARGIVTVYAYLRAAGAYNFKLIDLK